MARAVSPSGEKNRACDICGKSDNDPLELGEFMEKSGINVHYYCLLLSTHIVQAGKDTGGILGFLIKDIKNAIKDIKRKICFYCKEPSASIHCADCSKVFHLVCGLKNNCQFQFADTFPSYCYEHHKIRHPKKHSPIDACYICFSDMGEYNALTSVMAKCCSSGWVHRRCLKKFALSAGYYLKCLWCENEQFRNEIRLVGIFVPDRDAQWELDKEAYGDFYRGHSTCNALQCLCPQGRDYIVKKGKWTLLVCNACRSYGEHIECSKSKHEVSGFLCLLCKMVLHETSSSNRTSNNILANNSQLDVTLFMAKSQRPINQNIIDESYMVANDELQTSTAQFMEDELDEYGKHISGQLEKEQFIVIDKETNTVVGSLEAKRKNSANKDEFYASDLEFEKEDFYPIVNPSKENGYKILDEIIQNIVQKTVIASKFQIVLSDNEDE